mmetsp:Transcript_33231/g.71817  ORF Transcript_33231/g.71817 Transcript_33231/m.71817 type:complete len:1016 (-) Transcript_33231:462-3509(-)
MPKFRSPTCVSSEDAERCLHLPLTEDRMPVFRSRPSLASSEDAERSYDGSSFSLTSAPTKRVYFDSDDDDSGKSEESEESEAVSTAQYVKGIVGMARGILKNIYYVKKIYRRGVFLIDISDGGSILFYSRSMLTDAPGDEIKAGTDRGTGVSVCASISSFVEPNEEPYLRIPADVPWKFQVVGTNSFQIVVPPRNGNVDYRVELKKPSYLLRKKANAKLHNGIDAATDASETTHGDNGDPRKKKSQQRHVFAFRCKVKGEVAVYAKAAQSLGRNDSRNKNAGGGYYNSVFPNSNVRIRTPRGIEIATQIALVGRTSSVRHRQADRQSSLGEQEFRCFPLYCFPNTWMTKRDLVAELPRKSKRFHDLRRNAPDEIGNLKVEVLQCIGLPKMDRVGLSDPYCFVVCGSKSFVTDVIPDNCNPCWLPPTRRACIMPIHNAYSQVYVGVFDYDGEKTSDDFIGRVVVDIHQLPSGCTLSVTLPLRENSRVYNENRLGSIRLRLRLDWTGGGERAALLSYLPKRNLLSDIQKRTAKYLKDPVTVECPDAKSFHNVALTVYGKDMPGRFTNDMKDAVAKEVALIRIFVIRTSKTKIVDLIRWRNPVISLYFFYGWMRFVITTSGTFLAMYVLSLFFIFMVRNYLKYNINSPASRFLGRRTIGGMTRALLVNQGGFKGPTLDDNQGISHSIERAILWMAGIPKNSTPDSWKGEDHAEFPFSTGSVYTKASSDEAAAMPVWEAEEAAEAAEDHFSDESNSSDILDNVDDSIDDEIKKNALAKMRLPNQDVCNAPTSERKSLSTQIQQIHYKVQRANLHLFDDRVFIAEDRAEAKKQLKMNNTKNPISKRINPWLANILKIFEYEVSAFRAMFNILFWKDPILSYWAMMFLCCVMILVLVFPWRRFFFVVGILLLGPQNYFMNIIDWHRSKMAKKKGGPESLALSKSTRMLNAYRDNEHGSGQNVHDPPQSRNDDLLSNSPLLLRNNTQQKPDGKLRKVIVPSVPFRYNRFYDWPPDPDSTNIK